MPYAGGRPYGDIFTISTAGVDAMANRLYAEGRQRDAQKQQDLKTLDDDFGKNIAGIKSADVNDVTAAYNDFKQASIALQKKGNKATPQDQMEVMLKRANAYEAIGKSKEDKERIKQYGLTIKSDNKGRYKTDAAQKLTQWLNTPTSKRDVDADQSEIKFAYSYPNLAKLTTDALGKKTEYKMPTGKPSAKGDLYDDEEVYNKFNSANQIFDHIFNTVATDPNNNAFTLTVMDNMTDVEKDALKTKYFAKINDPAFKKLYGDTLPFPESASKTDLGEAAALATMGIVANLSIDKLRTDSKVNENAKNTAKNAEWDRRNEISFGQSMAKIKANKAAGLPYETDSDYISDTEAEKNGDDLVLEDKSGKKTTRRVIYVDKVDKEKLKTIVGTDKAGQLSTMAVEIEQPDGTYRRGYYQNQDTGDWEGVTSDRLRLQTIGREEARVRYKQQKESTKFKSQSLQNKKQFSPANKPKSDPLKLF